MLLQLPKQYAKTAVMDYEYIKSGMGSYSIREIESLTGIKAHTIRIWEKRHNLINPERTETNIRLYSDEDVKHILNVSTLYNHGYKISKIAKLSPQQVSQKIHEISRHDSVQNSVFIDRLTVCMIEYDEKGFHELLTQSIKQHGFENTILRIVYPFLRKVGVLWLSNHIHPAQEHFISNLIRQKLAVATDSIPYPSVDHPKQAVLFLPEGELHELGLLFYNYLLRTKGYRTYYLGQSVPLKDVIKTVSDVQPDLIVCSLSFVQSDSQLSDFLSAIDDQFQDLTMAFTGKPLLDRESMVPDSIKLFASAEELLQIA